MAHLTVSEGMEMSLGRLFYAAGAVFGVARGLLEVTARLVLAGLHAAIAKDTFLKPIQVSRKVEGLLLFVWRVRTVQAVTSVSPDHALLAIAFVQTKVPVIALEPPRTIKVDEPVPHGPTDISGAPSASASSGKKAFSQTLPAEASWTSIDAAAWSSADVNTASSDAASGDSGREIPGNSTNVQLPKVAAEAAANVVDISIMDGDTVLSAENGDVGDVSLPSDLKIIAAGTADVDPDAADVPAAAEAGGDAPEQLLLLQSTHTSPLFAIELPTEEEVVTAISCSEIPNGDVSVSNHFEHDDPPLEPTRQSEMAAELERSLSPSRILKVPHESEEAFSESGESGSTAISFGTVNSVDTLTGLPMSRRLKAAITTPSVASSTVSTPGLPLSQRLEERRHNSRRKGAHKARAR
ncbi:hypothetical protein VaNZ11_005816 [Volvox africanus]|uniref:Uncharacterized protein n=1 Tax=Volvox africanus TaxID=51714 RepID=A0ABQ5RZM5_9CHLO|nr:hypothetical protein VaNZ11_005816 [Volvox africanus]